VVRVRGSLESAQVRAIRHLAASAVNGLKPQRVSIVDETGLGGHLEAVVTEQAEDHPTRFRWQLSDV
jgi:flagellar biosynthesis/type III secretory pathway M-ring protein FliF/YscJ